MDFAIQTQQIQTHTTVPITISQQVPAPQIVSPAQVSYELPVLPPIVIQPEIETPVILPQTVPATDHFVWLVVVYEHSSPLSSTFISQKSPILVTFSPVYY